MCGVAVPRPGCDEDVNIGNAAGGALGLKLAVNQPLQGLGAVGRALYGVTEPSSAARLHRHGPGGTTRLPYSAWTKTRRAEAQLTGIPDPGVQPLRYTRSRRGPRLARALASTLLRKPNSITVSKASPAPSPQPRIGVVETNPRWWRCCSTTSSAPASQPTSSARRYRARGPARATARRHPARPHAAVLDGLELARTLKRDERTARIPILVLTAKSEEVDRIVGFELGPTTTSPSRSAPARWSSASRPCCAARSRRRRPVPDRRPHPVAGARRAAARPRGPRLFVGVERSRSRRSSSACCASCSSARAGRRAEASSWPTSGDTPTTSTAAPSTPHPPARKKLGSRGGAHRDRGRHRLPAAALSRMRMLLDTTTGGRKVGEQPDPKADPVGHGVRAPLKNEQTMIKSHVEEDKELDPRRDRRGSASTRRE